MFKKKLKYIITLAIFLLIGLIVFFINLNQKQDISQILINKSFPKINEKGLGNYPKFTPNDFLNKVSVVNVFASWCFGCFQEHPNIMELSKKYNVYGVLFKDTEKDATDYLNNYGNPYKGIINDYNGRLSVDLGVEAVPETFIVDKKGMIRYKFTGYIRKKDMNNIVIPILKYLDKE